MAADSCNPEWYIYNYFNNHDILGEWTIKEEPKCQYLFRLKDTTDWNLTSAKYSSEEDLRKSLSSFCSDLGDFKEDWEFRRIEP